MKLKGYIQRLEAHKERIRRLETSGELGEMYRYDKQRWTQLYKRLGYLKQRVESLKEAQNDV